ncbi:flippase [Candidatus Nanohalobium constans]|uniref:Polysaccharide biosynthesis protein n=1 Tax=Candidatus Nanohalobium constans TaxID=2565781 RepID=A0A5Q0UH99_9ARCH|nr:flippase [Candidatus Nanohalobium constans]QGA81053.1 polysaccharide biosynthesis protein [Candidatus Nanohalobium constans]
MGDADQKALNALAKGAGVTAIGMGISKVLTYLYRVSIARFVGPEAYGQLSTALMVVGIASTVAYLALGSGLKKFIPEFRSRDDFASIKGIVISALQLTVPVSIIIFLAVFFGAEFIAVTIFENPKLVPLIKILSFTIPAGTLSRLFFDTTLGFNKIIYKTGTVRIFQNIVQLGTTLILLLMGFKVVSAAYGWLLGTVVAAILGFYFMEKKVGPILFSKTKPSYHRKKLLRFSTPLLLSGIIGTLLGWADTGLLQYFMEDLEVGLYNAALPTAILILLPHKAIGSLAITSFSELKERDKESVESSIQRATYWVFSLVFPTFLIMLLFSDKILQILWGSEYTQASIALSILATGYLIDALVGRVGSLLQSEGHTKYILYNNTAALTLNIILNIILIPPYGIAGAAIATATSTILTNVLMYIEVRKKEGINSIPHKKISKIVLTGLIPLSIIITLDTILFTNTPYWFLIPAGTTYITTYILLFLKTIGLGEEEKEVFLRIGEITGTKDKVKKILATIERRI